MAAALVLNEAQILAVTRSFLVSILSTGTTVIRGQQNRVSEPEGDYIVMTPMLRNRLSTNVVTYADAAFVGSISGQVLTVTQSLLGSVLTGATLFGSGVANGTTIIGQYTGTGGTGTYQVSSSQTVASGTLASGAASCMQPTQVSIQLDVHGPNANDNAQLISTLFRSGYACEAFARSGFDVSPLHADDPRQMPFVNAAQQYEYRWVVTALVQANQVVTFPQQFAGALAISSLTSADR